MITIIHSPANNMQLIATSTHLKKIPLEKMPTHLEHSVEQCKTCRVYSNNCKPCTLWCVMLFNATHRTLYREDTVREKSRDVTVQ